MTKARIMVRANRELATEVNNSCAVGDHVYHSRQWLRGAHGLLQLVVSSIANSGRTAVAPPARGVDVLFAVSNPVAHGSRLALAVVGGVESSVVTPMADYRFSDSSLPAGLSFPGISARSLKGIVTMRHLAFAVTLRTRLPRRTPLRGAASRLYAEYLFVAQAIRFLTAESVVSSLGERVIVMTDFDRHTYSWPLLWSANAAGLKTITLLHGSPNDANYIPFLADYALVWGEVQRDWVAEHSPATRAIVVGRPEIGLVPLSRSVAERVVVCHSREVLSGPEATSIARHLRAFGDRGLRSVLRLHPTAREQDLDEGWSSIARLADDVVVGLDSFLDSLRASDIVVCVGSSSAVESVQLGIPTIVLADADRVLPADLEAIRATSSELLDALQNFDGATTDALLGALSSRMVAATGERASELLDDALAKIRRS